MLSFDDTVVLQSGPQLTGGSPSSGLCQGQDVQEQAARVTEVEILGPQQPEAHPGELRHRLQGEEARSETSARTPAAGSEPFWGLLLRQKEERDQVRGP